MITEDFVSFETAELLKKKGFDSESITAYYFFMEGSKPILNRIEPQHFVNQCGGNISLVGCSTLQMAMKWLREVHKLEITSFHEMFQGNSWWYRIERNTSLSLITEYEEDSIYGSYEQAAEAAIKYCLENLI